MCAYGAKGGRGGTVRCAQPGGGCAGRAGAQPSCSGRGNSDIQFDAWPQVVVTVPEGIDILAHGKVSRLQTLLRRQFSLIRYGRPRRLTTVEKASTKLGVTHISPTQMVLDFSRAATAFVGAIHARIAADGARALYPQGLFDLTATKENWPSAAARVGLAMVRKMSPAQIAGVALTGVIAACLAYSATTMWKDVLAYNLEAQSTTRQLPLPEINKTTVTAESGQTLAPPAHHATENDLELESRAVASIIIEGYKGPFSDLVNTRTSDQSVSCLRIDRSFSQPSIMSLKSRRARVRSGLMLPRSRLK